MQSVVQLDDVSPLSVPAVLLLLTGRLGAQGKLLARHDPPTKAPPTSKSTAVGWPAVSSATNVRVAVRLAALVGAATAFPGSQESALHYRHSASELLPASRALIKVEESAKPTNDTSDDEQHARRRVQTRGASKVAAATAALIVAAKMRGAWVDARHVADVVCGKLGFTKQDAANKPWTLVSPDVQPVVTWLRGEIDAFELITMQYAVRLPTAVVVTTPEHFLRRFTAVMFHEDNHQPHGPVWPDPGYEYTRLIAWLLLAANDSGNGGLLATTLEDAAVALDDVLRRPKPGETLRLDFMEAVNRVALALLNPDALWNPALWPASDAEAAAMRMWLLRSPMAHCMAAMTAALSMVLHEGAALSSSSGGSRAGGRGRRSSGSSSSSNVVPTLTQMDDAGSKFAAWLVTPLATAFPMVGSREKTFSATSQQAHLDLRVACAPPAVRELGSLGHVIRYAAAFVLRPLKQGRGEPSAASTDAVPAEDDDAILAREWIKLFENDASATRYCQAGCHLSVRPPRAALAASSKADGGAKDLEQPAKRLKSEAMPQAESMMPTPSQRPMSTAAPSARSSSRISPKAEPAVAED